jgi:putative endonuclease
MTNTPRGVLYVGMTRDLPGWAYEHREGLHPGFAKRYGCTRLVWFETHLKAASADRRARAIKRWRRSWKIEPVERDNPTWSERFDEVVRAHGFDW